LFVSFNKKLSLLFIFSFNELEEKADEQLRDYDNNNLNHVHSHNKAEIIFKRFECLGKFIAIF
jgi:hypothetical protein